MEKSFVFYWIERKK